MNKFALIQNDLVPVYKDDQEQKVVNARELHEFLGSRQEFANWIKNRIQKYGFIEGEDFLTTLSKSTGGRPSTDYYLRMDTAKEIAMVENNERGRQARRYFIEIEKRYKQEHQMRPTSIEDLIIMQAQSMKEMRVKVTQIEERTTAAHHRIDTLDSLNTIGDPKQRLNAMVRKYATDNGIGYQEAWRAFRKAFNTAYHTNLKTLIENYKGKHGLKKLTMPEYLERVSRLDDAMRVADKMLNRPD